MARSGYRDLHRAVSAILYRHDPVGLATQDQDGPSNTDEYDPEAGTILPRLRGADGPDDVEAILHEVFVHWFGAETVGSRDRFAAPASEIWSLWLRRLG